MARKYSCWDIWVYLLYSDTNSLCDHLQTTQPESLSMVHLSLKHTAVQLLLETENSGASSFCVMVPAEYLMKYKDKRLSPTHTHTHTVYHIANNFRGLKDSPEA